MTSVSGGCSNGVICASCTTVALACTLNTSGVSGEGVNTAGGGEASASTSDTTDDAPTGAAPTGGTGSGSTTGDASGTTSTAEADASTSMADTEDTSTSAGASTGTAGDCSATNTFVELVADAVVTPPMTTALSTLGEGIYASSAEANAGSVEFALDIACSGLYFVWGRVYDAIPGREFADPDSFRVNALGATFEWEYGCNTAQSAGRWSWQRLRSYGGFCTTNPVVAFDFSAGTHILSLTNIEPQETFPNRRAVIARIVVTDDQAFVPQ